MAGMPRLFGADYSVYVRIARLVLTAKNVDYELVPVDIFAKDGVPDWYPERHPFNRIPAFEHGLVRLYETIAITRYVDEAFDGPPLQPTAPAHRAVMNQVVGLLDAYAYRPLVWGVYVERVSKPKRGHSPDEALIATSLEQARTCLAALSALKRNGQWLLGDQLTLADLHAALMFACFVQAPEGQAMLSGQPSLSGWWEGIQSLASMAATQPSH
ncbi:MAG: glutathione S-transferase family protein [Rhizobiaceae bacterium]